MQKQPVGALVLQAAGEIWSAQAAGRLEHQGHGSKIRTQGLLQIEKRGDRHLEHKIRLIHVSTHDRLCEN